MSFSMYAGAVSRPLPTTQPAAVRRRRSERILAKIVRHFGDWSSCRTAAPIRAALGEHPCQSHADHSQLARDGRQVDPTETLQARVEKCSAPKDRKSNRKLERAWEDTRPGGLLGPAVGIEDGISSEGGSQTLSETLLIEWTALELKPSSQLLA